MSELPKGWVETTLSEIGKWGSGGTPKATNEKYYGGTIPWAKIGDLNDGIVLKTEDCITEEGLLNSSAKLVQIDTLLIAMYGSIGKLGIAGVRLATNQAIAFCKIYEKLIIKELAFYYLRYRREHLLSIGQGGTQQNISQTILKAYPILLPPLKEQRRIVAKLDSLFARSRRAREELERIPKLCDRYKQAVLAAACSGRLTADWREQSPILETASELMKRVVELRKKEHQEECSLTKEGSQKKLELEIFEINADLDKYALNEIPSSWIWSCIDNLGRVKGGKRLPKGISLSKDDTGFIYIRAGDLKNGTVLTDDLRFVPKDIQPLIKNYTVSAGDVYITIVGACIGDSGIIPAHLSGANLTENAAKISNLLGCSNYYLSIWGKRGIRTKSYAKTEILS